MVSSTSTSTSASISDSWSTESTEDWSETSSISEDSDGYGDYVDYSSILALRVTVLAVDILSALTELAVKNTLVKETEPPSFSSGAASSEASSSSTASSDLTVIHSISMDTLNISESGTIVIDENAWRDHFGVEIEGAIPEKPIVSQAQNCTLLLMPKGMTVVELLEIMKIPMKVISPKILEKYGEMKVESNYWVLLTNKVHGKFSFRYDYEDLQKQLDSESEGKVTLAHLIELLAASGFHMAGKGMKLFDEITSAVCLEKVDDSVVAVGIQMESGLHVYHRSQWMSITVGYIAALRYQ